MHQYQTLNDFLERRANETPNNIAIVYKNIKYTWGQISELSDKCASFFLEKGLKKGSHVGILGQNSIEWILSFLSLAKIGAIPVLINAQCTTTELMRILEYADVTHLLHGEGIKNIKYSIILDSIDFSVLKKFKKKYYIENRLLDEIEHIEIDDEMLSEAKAKVEGNDTLCMLFTSGTTSVAKGVLLSHSAMINVAASAADIMHWNSTDVNCMALPLFHCFGLSTGLFASIHTGGSIVVSESNRTLELLTIIDKYKCTILNGVPTMFLAMIRNPHLNEFAIGSLKSGIIAGSSVCYEDYKRICDKLGMTHLQTSYGQTESSPSITFADYDDSIELKSKSVGKVIPDVTMRIVSIDNPAVDCKNLEVGEIVIKGYNVMKEYYNMPEETRKTIDENGWLHTGDIGYVDDDGYLYLVGRIKEMIIRGGENISPYEIENCIVKMPGVQAVKVLGVKSEILQEEIVACIVKDGTIELTEDKVKEFVSGELAGYKVPKHVLFMDSFPLNASGKIIIKELKKSVDDMLK